MTKDFIQQELQDLIDEPVFLKTVPLPAKGFWNKMAIRLKLKKPNQLDLYIKQATLRTSYKITSLILALRANSDRQGTDVIIDIMNANVYQLATIVATAIHNKNEDLPDYLVEVVLDNFVSSELKNLCQEVYRGLDVQNFFGSMELLKELAITTGTPATTVSQPSSETSNLPTN